MALVEVVYRLTLSLWTGAMAYLALLATPALFAGLPREEAARAVGLLFPGYLQAGYAAAGILFVSALLLARAPARYPRRRDPLARFRVLATAVLLGLAVYGGRVLYPEALRLLSQVPSLAPDAVSPERAAFERVHGLAFGLNALALGLAALLLLVETARDAGRRRAAG